jgi:hypothetical protein
MRFLGRLERLNMSRSSNDQGKRVLPKNISDHGNSWPAYFCDPDGNSYEITTYDYAEVASHKTRFRE